MASELLISIELISQHSVNYYWHIDSGKAIDNVSCAINLISNVPAYVKL